MKHATKPRYILVAGCLALLGTLRFSAPALSGFISKDAPQKMTVYQGVVMINPGSGSSIMEVGNAGRDIVSTGSIYLRPSGTHAASSFIGAQNSNVQDLYLSGTLDVANCISIAGGPCNTSWSSGGGSSTWKITDDTYFLTTFTSAQAVRIGSAGNPVTAGPAFQYGAGQLFATNRGGGGAARFDGRTEVKGMVRVRGQKLCSGGDNAGAQCPNGDECGPGGTCVDRNPISINGFTAWDEGNDGEGSGLLGDKIDNTTARIEPASSCSNASTQAGPPPLACLCFTGVRNAVGNFNKCFPLTNYI